MTTGALNNGFSPSTRLDCSSGFQVGNRWFKNYESASYGLIGFDQALQISCDTFFYRVGYRFWQKYGTDEGDVNAKDPLVKTAKLFGFGKPTGIDLPGEAQRPDRRPALEAGLLEGQQGATTARSARSPATTSCTSSPASSASRATPTAPVTRSTS